MKKNFLLLISIFTLMACNDDCDHKGPGPGPDSIRIINPYEYLANGPWYDESDNEEIRYTESGTYYDTYSKPTIANETNGRYEVDADNKRLTTTYTFMGQNQYGDWKIKEMEELHFTITSDQVGSHTLEKIVEKYKLNVGDSQKIQFENNYPSYSVNRFSSNNEYIATVTSDGVITATGEKGSTYIKIATDKGNAWVKVTVGEERADLWYDYALLIGKDYAGMIAFMGDNPALSTPEGHEYRTTMHNTVSAIDIFMNEEGRIDEVALVLKDGSQSAVKSYIASRYYEFGEELDNYYLYQTGPTLDESKAVVAYAKDGLSIRFGDIESWKAPVVADLWPDYTAGFNKSLSELIALYGEPYFDTFWLIEDNEYALYIYFYLDDNTSKTTAYVITLKDGVSSEDIITYLASKYNYYASQDNMFAFFDTEDRTDANIQIVYNANSGAVTYYDLNHYGKSNSVSKRVKDFEALNFNIPPLFKK